MAGADLGFSEGAGGGRIFKRTKNFVDLCFLRSTKLISRALPEPYEDPISIRFHLRLRSDQFTNLFPIIFEILHSNHCGWNFLC